MVSESVWRIQFPVSPSNWPAIHQKPIVVQHDVGGDAKLNVGEKFPTNHCNYPNIRYILAQ